MPWSLTGRVIHSNRPVIKGEQRRLAILRRQAMAGSTQEVCKEGVFKTV
jgi:hypothetical protein